MYLYGIYSLTSLTSNEVWESGPVTIATMTMLPPCRLGPQVNNPVADAMSPRTSPIIAGRAQQCGSGSATKPVSPAVPVAEAGGAFPDVARPQELGVVDSRLERTCCGALGVGRRAGRSYSRLAAYSRPSAASCIHLKLD